MTSTPAARLREAAATIRQHATAVRSGNWVNRPWHTEQCSDEERGHCPCIVAQGLTSHHDEPSQPMFYVADAETPECAAYIALMHPGVGEALARWLELEADVIAARAAQSEGAEHAVDISGDHALAVADALLGEVTR